MHNHQPMIFPETKVSDIIMNNYYQILMLEYFEIVLPVKEKSVREVCKEYYINEEVFLTFANLFNGVHYEPATDYSFEDLQTIIGYLKNCHEYYLAEKYPRIQRHIARIQELNNSPEIKLVEHFFNEYFNEVKIHLDYENSVVFPYIVSLFQALKDDRKSGQSNSYSVIEYKDHHDDIEVKLTDIKNLLIKYLPQQQEQKERRKLLFSLFELEFDLNIHAQIEDSILIPLVEKMELQLKGEGHE